MRGRFHYNDALDGFNFTAAREPLCDILDELTADAPSTDPLYVGSTDLDIFLPGFAGANPLPLNDGHPLEKQRFTASIWLGNRTTTATHYDYSNNIAICGAGRRRFTLFPPDQISNLYPGPLEPTPGGQVVSMVDLADPDFDRYPNFARALAVAQIADLEPGDVLVYPAMWWHQVDALDSFNVLVNFWWDSVADHHDSPQVTLRHALLSLRDRPADERAAWAAVFDHYIFGDTAAASAHLPAHARGPLAPIDAIGARRLRAAILKRLQR